MLLFFVVYTSNVKPQCEVSFLHFGDSAIVLLCHLREPGLSGLGRVTVHVFKI